MKWFKPAPVFVVAEKPLSAAELSSVIRSVPDDAPLLRAFLQLLEEEVRTAQGAAEDTVADHGICASEVGGAQHLRRLRDRLWAIKYEGRRMKEEG